MVYPKYQTIIDEVTARQIGRVGVLHGGLSDEREVSLWSGQAVYEALITAGIDAVLIDVSADFLSVAMQRPFDYAFIVLHGRGGEDGTIQAILDWLKIPYTGSGVCASAIAMDKIRTKQLWQAGGLPVLPQKVLTPDFDAEAVIAEVGLPMAVKPALEGSSNGISKVTAKSQLAAAYDKAAKHNTVVMAESWVEGDELTGAIIGELSMPLIRIKVTQGFYDYTTKYVTGASEYRCPCGLPAEEEYAIQALMRRAADLVGCKDWCRVDVMRDQQGQTWLIEVNTIPGMTKTSLVPKATAVYGWDFTETVLRILKTSWEGRNA